MADWLVPSFCIVDRQLCIAVSARAGEYLSAAKQCLRDHVLVQFPDGDHPVYVLERNQSLRRGLRFLLADSLFGVRLDIWKGARVVSPVGLYTNTDLHPRNCPSVNGNTFGGVFVPNCEREIPQRR